VKAECKVNAVTGIRVPPALRRFYGMREFIPLDEVPNWRMVGDNFAFLTMDEISGYESKDDTPVL